MTARARLRRVTVRAVAVGAARVCSRSEDRLIGVARDTRLGLRRRERMRHVTARTCRVARGDRASIDVERASLHRVAALAARVCRARRLVHVMAVETAGLARMGCHLSGVARRTRLRVECGRRVRVVAGGARLIAMRADRGRGRLVLVVAPHAARRADHDAGCEAVAVPATGRVGAGVERCRHAGMAAHTEPGRRRRETGVAVARSAGDLADVFGVALAGPDRVVDGRYLFGGRLDRRGAGDQRHSEGERDRTKCHGREPIG
jgi:hypothetical protein